MWYKKKAKLFLVQKRSSETKNEKEEHGIATKETSETTLRTAYHYRIRQKLNNPNSQKKGEKKYYANNSRFIDNRPERSKTLK